MPATRLANRAVIRVAPAAEGEDAAAFLQGLLTNDVTGDLPAYAALLTPQGKTMTDMLVWREGEAMLLECEAAHADELARRLSLYRLRRKLDIARDETLAAYWSPTQREGFAADPRLPALGWRRIAPLDDSVAAGDGAWLDHRLAAGVPEGADEMADILWLETNAVDLNGVSFSKGCYIGQENTARMNWRQKVNRRLLVVPYDRSDEKRRKAAYPERGYAVDHLRVADIPAKLAPGWMSLEPAEE
ncbi:CAF17-like 4Fe-4S cluster assembly/insertion protein YgfZ [Aurantiacibacter spongiae]|uniref:Folate-binding protein n=1 Tax=Aurantiacibacter spongiae TaxID=2488860 RepID=A0A3N5DP05_9SPHN|nr:folate-binding protein [Aurantiacibacter spongiae]RPF70821.1 folate-binding protein [Aurantiacibacter spongiae]